MASASDPSFYPYRNYMGTTQKERQPCAVGCGAEKFHLGYLLQPRLPAPRLSAPRLSDPRLPASRLPLPHTRHFTSDSIFLPDSGTNIGIVIPLQKPRTTNYKSYYVPGNLTVLLSGCIYLS